MDALDLIHGGCVREILKSRTNSAKEQWHPEEAGRLLGKAGGEGVQLLPAPPPRGDWVEGHVPRGAAHRAKLCCGVSKPG